MKPTYGPTWLAFRDWYRAQLWLPWRCWWCLAGPRRGNPIQLNHLTYADPDPNWPAWWHVVPMCLRCHEWETALTRYLFGDYPYRRTRNAHYWVTFGVLGAGWLAIVLTLVALVLTVLAI